MQTTDWMAGGACVGYERQHGSAARDAVFFPGPHSSAEPAKAICADCPVRQACAEYAIANPMFHGVWGGLTESDRRRERRRRARQARQAMAVAS